MEFFLSQILDKPIYNKSNEQIGWLKDVVIRDISKAHPLINGLLLTRAHKKEASFIPMHDISAISPKNISLATDVVNLSPFIQRNDEVLLVNNVYDKQIVDIDDRRLTRVNDLQIEANDNLLRLKGVDVSIKGLLKRLHIPDFKIFKPNIVDWEDVQFLGTESAVKVNVQYKKLELLHPVDIARIIFEGPGYKQGSRVLASLKDPIAADIIEELSPKLQKNLIESMKLTDVADVVDHMPPDKAADLLLVLGNDYARKIIPLLKKDHANDILSLLRYPEYSTGAHMTTEFLSIPQEGTVEESFKLMRDLSEMPDFTYYVYVTESKSSNKLVGVVGANDLYTADFRSRIESIMTKKLINAYPHDHIKKTLKKMYRYNTSAIPVISKSDNKLLGIVTFREAVSVILPKKWKIRTRQIYSNGDGN